MNELNQTRHPLSWLLSEWEDYLVKQGEKPFRARQIFRSIHYRQVRSWEEMTDLSKALRERLSAQLPALSVLPVVERTVEAGDGTRKLLFRLQDGAAIECVLIPMTGGGEDESLDAGDEIEGDKPATRVTLCVSTQYGCAMGCVFCASGREGLKRGLRAEEILAQIYFATDSLAPGEILRNLVFMGMGEPLHHYDETARALRLLFDSLGQDWSPRRVTVSTVGLVPGIRRLGEDFDGKVGLALSLHAPDDATRERIMPMTKRYPVAALIDALRAYPLPLRRRITIEYTLMQGVNDSDEQARALVRLLRGIPVKVNLIPMNPVEGAGLQPPSRSRVESFQRILAQAGLSCFLRTRRGDEVTAACGQLAFQGKSGLIRQPQAE